MNRRQFFKSVVLPGAALTLPSLLIACGGDDEDGPATEVEGNDRSTRELRVATNVFPVSLDPDVGFTSFSLMGVGAGEALTRITPDMKLEPWLAEKISQVDPNTWRVTIRSDATFWDGSPVDAAAVKASFERTIEKQAGAVSFAFPAGTSFKANGRELDITTPVSIGVMPSNLSLFYLIVKKVGADGSVLMTGQYKVEDFVDQQSLTLKAFEAHRDGPARTEIIRLKRVPDVATRMLALQSGDVDLAFAMLPSQLPQMKASGLAVDSFLFGRLNGIILNNTRAPLDDLAVRKAIALGIDRTSLVEGVLEGQGKPAYGIVTRDWGFDYAVETQRFDRAAANKALDDAGWTRAADGTRAKNGTSLAFTLGFYKSRAELEPFSVVVRDQLKQLGMDVRLEEILDINRAVAENTFDATLYSYTVTPSGDINRGLAQLFIPGSSNKDRYSNPRVNALYDQYNATAEPERRSALAREMQTLIGEDVPFVYLAFPNQLVARSSKVSGYTPHLLENYQLDGRLYIGS